MSQIIKYGKLREDAIIPSKREGDGCYDYYASFEADYLILPPHAVTLIPTGLCSTFPREYRVALRERGSNTKWGGIVMAGQIDSNYTGEHFVAIYNTNEVPIYIDKGVEEIERHDDGILYPYRKAICQMAIEEVPRFVVQEVPAEYIQNLNTERGDGKLGSSQK